MRPANEMSAVPTLTPARWAKPRTTGRKEVGRQHRGLVGPGVDDVGLLSLLRLGRLACLSRLGGLDGHECSLRVDDVSACGDEVVRARQGAATGRQRTGVRVAAARDTQVTATGAF